MKYTFEYDPNHFPTLSVVLPSNGLCWVYSYDDSHFRTQDENLADYGNQIGWLLYNWDEIMRQAKEYLLKESL